VVLGRASRSTADLSHSRELEAERQRAVLSHSKERRQLISRPLTNLCQRGIPHWETPLQSQRVAYLCCHQVPLNPEGERPCLLTGRTRSSL
jgi:hypothetical protein